ncbi:MAG TPA: dynamin family protein [Thermoanaerobaculia bacterium]|nr:dynamin family protein [Thermoanaerobaculia bacterium]
MAELNESHRRHLGASVRYIADLLEEAERIVVMSRSGSPFRNYKSDLAGWQLSLVGDYVERTRQKLLAFAERFGIDAGGHTFDVRHSLHVQATMSAISVDDMRAGSLRGYGHIDDETARAIDNACDDLEHTLEELDRFVIARGESIEERIERLENVSFDTGLLAQMANVIRSYGFVEFRPALQSLVRRLEEKTFNIALFGRVSAGKSSLLNALLGAPLLPVGVTPITAIPARVRSGSPARILVRFEEGQPQELPIEQLREFASEEFNPDNRKRVSRLDVICPSTRVPEGVEFVDTPGIGALATGGAAETFAYLPRADIAVVLIDIGSSIGSDELMILRLLVDAAIPVRIALSKGDLVDGGSRERMQRYVIEAVRKELGTAPPVSVVSSVPQGAALLDAWLKSEIEPLLAESGRLRVQSINRIGEALRENLVARLEIEMRGAGGGAADSSQADEGRLAIGRLRDRFQGVPDRIRAEWRQVLEDAAAEIAASWKAHRKPVAARPVLSRLLHEAMLHVRREYASEFGSLKKTLTAAAAGHEQLLRDSWPAQELEGFPILDSAAILPDVSLPPPVLSAGGLARKRALDALHQRYEGAVTTPLRAYGTRLRDWAQRRLADFERPFLNTIDAAVATSTRSAADVAQIEADIASLRSKEPANAGH